MTNAMPDAVWPEDVVPLRPSLASSILTREQLNDLPTPEPLIGGTLDQGTVGLLAGYWGTYKSFLALDWAASLSTGTPWLGRPVEPVRVLYVAAEGAWGLTKRLAAWERQHGVQARVDVLPKPVHLLNAVDVGELCEVAAGRYDVAFVDTISKCIPGADENSAKDMSLAVSNLYRVQRALDQGRGAVLGVHHTGKDKTTIRGSSALEAGVDTVYLTEGDGYNLRVSRTKRKDGPREDVLNLQFQEVRGTGSGVLVPQSALADASSHENTILAAMREMFAETGASASALMDVCGMASTTFYRARGNLLRRHVLEVRGQRLFLVDSQAVWETDSQQSHEGDAL